MEQVPCTSGSVLVPRRFAETQVLPRGDVVRQSFEMERTLSEWPPPTRPRPVPLPPHPTPSPLDGENSRPASSLPSA